MTHLVAQLPQSAGRLAAWLNAWRILALVLGGLGLLAMLLALLVGLPGSSEMGHFAGWAWFLMFLLTAFIALSTWVYWQLLSWGKEWVERSAQLALHGGDTGRLRQLNSTLGRWIMGIVWATLALYLLGVLVGVGAAQLMAGLNEGNLGGAAALTIGTITLVLLTVIFLVSTYFPYTALHRFLAAATGRLGGQAQPLRAAASRLNTWCVVLVVLQVLGVLFNLIPDEDSGGMIVALLSTLVSAGMSLLYILPLLAAGRYATTLADVLDSGMGSGPDMPAPVTNSSQMGRLADQGEVTSKF